MIGQEVQTRPACDPDRLFRAIGQQRETVQKARQTTRTCNPARPSSTQSEYEGAFGGTPRPEKQEECGSALLLFECDFITNF